VSEDENRLIAERRLKLASLRAHGIAFPNTFRRDALAAQLQSTYADRDGAWFEANPVRVRVGGQLRQARRSQRSVAAVPAGGQARAALRGIPQL
jgi:lysyl-tRNA synthetase class 2